jgi:hypothetical protein
VCIGSAVTPRKRGMPRYVTHLAARAAMALIVALPLSVVSAQETAPNRPLSLALLDVPLTDALESLSRAANVSIVWEMATLGDRSLTRVFCRVDGGTAEAMLRCLTRSTGLDFVRLSSGTYVIINAAALPPAWAVVGGVVVDEGTGAPIPAARVHFKAQESATAFAHDDGGFRLARLLPGRYSLTVRAIGYRPYTTAIDLSPSVPRQLRLPLTRQDNEASPIVVSGIRPGDISARLNVAAIDAREASPVMGPPLWIPGSATPLGASRRDGVGDLHLQGGDVGEHPWRLDGVPMYDVSTLSGLLGLVSPVVIDQIQLKRTGFSVKEGSFATGVIDLTHALGTYNDSRAVHVSLDPLAVALRVTSPVRLAGGTGRAMVAGRTGLWDLTAPQALTRALRHWSAPDPVLLSRVSGFAALPGMEALDTTQFAGRVGNQAVSLHDGHAALRLAWGTGHEISTSVFITTSGVGYDGTSVDRGARALHTTDDFSWRTLGGQLTHQWLLGTRVRQRIQVRGSQHSLRHDVTMAMTAPGSAALPIGIAGGERNAIDEVAIQADWRIAAGERLALVTGTEVARTTSHLDLANRVLQPIRLHSAAWRGAAFAELTARLMPALYADAGVRVTRLGEGTYAEPRLALRGESRAAHTPWSWRVAGGGYHQFVSQFDMASTMPVALMPSMRFWLPASDHVPVAQAWHVTAEGVARIATGWEVRADLYARWHPTIPMLDYGQLYPLLQPSSAGQPTPVLRALGGGASFIRGASGVARGAGIRLVRDTRLGSATWRSEVGYDAGWATRQFPSRFAGMQQAPPWLEPHRVQLATEFATSDGLRIGARSRLVAQRPWALRQAYYDLFGAAPESAGLPIDMPGKMRRPTLLEVDIGASYTGRVAGREVEVAASVVNAMNRANVLDFGLRRSGAGYEMVPRFLPGRQPLFSVRIR